MCVQICARIYYPVCVFAHKQICPSLREAIRLYVLLKYVSIKLELDLWGSGYFCTTKLTTCQTLTTKWQNICTFEKTAASFLILVFCMYQQSDLNGWQRCALPLKQFQHLFLLFHLSPAATRPNLGVYLNLPATHQVQQV